MTHPIRLRRAAQTLARATRELPPSELLQFFRLRRRRSQARCPDSARRLHSFHPRALGGQPLWIREGTTDIAALEDLVCHGYYLPPVPLRAPGVILDLGANIGCCAAHFAALYPSARIVAVELDAGNAELARANTQAFSERVHVIEAAIWSHDGSVTYGGLNQDAFHVATGSPDGRRARALSVPTLFDEENTATVDFANIDIEGAEKQLFCDSDGQWLEGIGCLKVEIHHESLFTPILEVLRIAGFEAEKDTNHWSSIAAWRRPCVP